MKIIEIFKLFGSIFVDSSEAEKSISSTEGKFEKLGNKLGEIGKSVSNFGGTLTKAITLPAVAAGAALGGIALKKGFDRLVGIDTARAKLVGLGHDAESVETIMTSALDSVRGTAYGLEAAATTAASAVAAGIQPGEELTRYLSLAGDAAAIAGSGMDEMGSILNKVSTANKAYNGELQQLSDRGLPVYQWLAEEAGVTGEAVFKMASDGEISSEMLMNAIENNIGGAAKSMGEESFTAGIANTWAAVGRLGASFLDAGGKGGGFFSTIKDNIPQVIDFIDGLGDKAAIAGEKLGEMFAAAVDKVKDLKAKYDELSPPIQDVIQKIGLFGSIGAVAIGPLLIVIGTLISAIGAISAPMLIVTGVIAGLIAIGVALYQNWDEIKEKAIAVFSTFEPLFETVREAFQTFVDSLAPLWDALKGLFASLEPILVAIGVLLAGTLVTGFGIVISTISAVIAAIGPLLTAIVNIADFVTNMVLAVVALLSGDFAGAWDYVIKAGESAKDFFFNIFETIVNFVSTFVTTIVDFFKGLYMTLVGNSIIPDMVNEILDWFKNMFKWVVDVVKNIVKGVTDGFNLVKDNINAALEAAKKIITAVLDYWKKTFDNVMKFLSSLVKGDFEGMKNAIKAQMDNASQLITTIWNSIKSFFSTVLGDILIAVARKFTDMIQSIRGKMDDAFSAIRNVWDSVMTFFKGIDLYQIGRDILQGMINGVKSMARNVVDSVRGVVDDAIQGAKNLLGIKSPSRVFMEIGKFTGEGFEDGIDSTLRNIAGAASRMAEAAIPKKTNTYAHASTGGDRTVGTRTASSSPVIHQEINIHSPKHLSPSETARYNKRAAQELALQWR